MGIKDWLQRKGEEKSASNIIEGLRRLVAAVRAHVNEVMRDAGQTAAIAAVVDDRRHIALFQRLERWRSRETKVVEAQKKLFDDLALWSNLPPERSLDEVVLPALSSGHLVALSELSFGPVVVAAYRVCEAVARQKGVSLEAHTPPAILQLVNDAGDLYKCLATPKSPAANAEQEVGAHLLGALEVISAYADVLERGKPIYALSIEFSEADLPFSKERIRLSIEFLQVALRSPASRTILVKLLPPDRAKHVLSSQFEQSLGAGLVYLDGFVPFSPDAKQKAAIQEWNEIFEQRDVVAKEMPPAQISIKKPPSQKEFWDAARAGPAGPSTGTQAAMSLPRIVPVSYPKQARDEDRALIDQAAYDINFLKALKVLAEEGAAAAQHNLGVTYFKGRGVPQDYVEAMKWFRKAAEQSYAEAQFNVGVMYENGQGAPQDYVKAHQWFSLAAARFPASETESQARAVKSRDGIASKMTPTQVAEAQSLAREWKPK